MFRMALGTELRLIVERLVRRLAGRIVGQIAFGLLLVVLIPVVTILGIAVFAVLAVAVFGLYALLGEPESLAPIVGLGWFFGSLLVLFLVLLRGHRWLSRLLALADAPALAIDPYGDEPIIAAVEPMPSPIAHPSSTFEERVRTLDARHSPDHAVMPPSREPPP
jgi:hypothetical protein